MEYTQLKQPNLSIIGTEGLCLVYVREVFGVAAKYPTALSGWTNAIYRYSDQTPPSNIAVPIWFSYNQPAGHVAVWDKGTIYSTTAQGDKTFTSIQELITWMGESFAYLGWSEDINGVKVVEQVVPPAAPSPPVAQPAPAPTPVVTAPPAAPVPIPYAGQGTAYTVVVPLKGYQTATQAGNQANVAYEWVEPGDYIVYRYYSDANHDLVNISHNKTTAGYWVKNSENVVPPPAPTPVSDWSTTATVPVTVTEPNVENASTPGPNAYKTTYSTFKDNHGNAQPLYYVAEDNLPVTNFDTGKVQTIDKYQTVQISGTFMKDGLKYARPTQAANQGMWYGIAMLNANGNPNLLLESSVYDTTTTPVDKIALGKRDLQVFMTKGIYTLDKVMDFFTNKKKGK